MLQQNIISSDIMTLDKMGSRYPSRLSFSRSMLRRLLFDNWKISKSKFDLDEDGYGTVVYEILINNNTYSFEFSAIFCIKDYDSQILFVLVLSD